MRILLANGDNSKLSAQTPDVDEEESYGGDEHDQAWGDEEEVTTTSRESLYNPHSLCVALLCQPVRRRVCLRLHELRDRAHSVLIKRYVDPSLQTGAG